MLTTIIAQFAIDDGQWHTVEWARSNVNAQLFVDGILVGSSDTSDCKLNTAAPFYFGGTDPADYGRVIESIVSAIHDR